MIDNLKKIPPPISGRDMVFKNNKKKIFINIKIKNFFL